MISATTWKFILSVILGSFALTAIFTGAEIPFLKKKQFGQYIREEGPKAHQAKAGTPTMGGVAIYLGIAVTTIAAGIAFRFRMGDLLIMLLVTLTFGLIGFLDDFIKVAKKHNLGLRAWQKLALQILFSVLLAEYVVHFTDQGTDVWIPFINRDVDFGWFYVPFVVFVMVAMVNSVNLTDGLDGLCSGVTALVSFFFVYAALRFSVPESALYSAVICGACLGFLVFNHHPAKIFMGDTGSMMLGAGVTAAVILTKADFLIPIAGFVYVLESLSVIIQVVSFQKRGKRVFRMAPIHHHFELGGMKEQEVVYMFWGFTAACIGVAYLITLIG